jgi:energy-coupling factor transporter ATP-binding protein EcfA2
LPYAELVPLAVKLLDIAESIIETAIAQEIADEVLLPDTVEGQACVFLAPLYYAEQSIAAQIQRLHAGGTTLPAFDADKAIPWVEQKLSIQLADSQKEAIRLALSSKLLVITGGPGVGKTTLVNSILTIMTVKGVKPLLCAPTGRAAKRLSESTGLEAKTIHRLLEDQSDQRPVQAQRGQSPRMRSSGGRRMLDDRRAAGESVAQGSGHQHGDDSGRRRGSTALGRPRPVPHRSHRLGRRPRHPADRSVPPGGHLAHRAQCPPDQPGRLSQPARERRSLGLLPRRCRGTGSHRANRGGSGADPPARESSRSIRSATFRCCAR